MRYIDALELIESCIKKGVLNEVEGKVAVYKNGTSKYKEGWYAIEKDTVAKELMNDENGQKILISTLNKV